MLIGLGGGAASSMATGASDAELDFASVQRGNPEMQHRCQEVLDQCWQLGEENPIAFIHDVGAGGLSNALPELVKDGGVGGEFELRDVPSEEPGMSPLEVWCNEAQERYVLAVEPDDLDRFTKICERERCPYAIVGTAIDDAHLLVNDRLLESTPVDLPLSVLFGKPPAMHKDVKTRMSPRVGFDSKIDLGEAIMRVVAHPTVAGKSFLITIGDRTVGGLVARDQMVGPWQTPVSDVGVTAGGYVGVTGEAMAMGERTPLALLDSPASGRMAVGEAITNIAAARIRRIEDIKLSANWMAASGHPGEDANLYRTVEAVGLELCPKLGICIPVGKDSVSMQTRWHEGDAEKSVTAPLSLIVSSFAPVSDARDTLTPTLSRDGGTVILFIDIAGRRRLGGSIVAQCFGQMGDDCPNVDDPARLKHFFELMQDDAVRGKILAYHDRSDGGLIAALLEMAFAGRAGLDVHLEGQDLIETLFNEELGALLQVKASDVEAIRKAFEDADLTCLEVAAPAADQRISIEWNGRRVYDESRAALQKRWWRTGYEIQRLRDNPACADEELETIGDDEDPGLSVQLTYDIDEDISAPFLATGARPELAILREQGVNSQSEMAAAFYRAGFDCIDVHMTDILHGGVSFDRFKGLIACGGFSYGDVLGAGEGWAKSILFHPEARDAFEAFFHRPDTFGLGVCNGCQMFAALKSLIPGAGLWPGFVINRSEQFEARFSLVHVQQSNSILMAGMAGSHMPVAVSHGEGRAEIVEDIEALLGSGRVTLRFVDNRLQFTETYPANPNGSPAGITGLTNEDGRFTIMMPHPERVYRAIQNSWHPDGWQEDGPWMRMFRNARVWVE